MFVNGFIEATWHDDYLQWDPANYTNVTELVVPPTRVWLPDFGVLNSAETFYDETYFEYFRVWLFYDGTVTWSFGGLLQTSCELDTTYYPVDTQTCSIVLENWVYSHQFVNLTNGSDHVSLTNFREHGLWAIGSTKASSKLIILENDQDNPIPRVEFELQLQRKPRYYIINIVVPCFFLTSIALLVFVLPPESGEKVSLGVTILLAFSVFQFVIADHTPVNSDCTPLLSIFVTITMGLSTTSVITTVLVLHLYHEGSTSPVPRLVQLIFFRCISPLVGLGVRRSTAKKSTQTVMATGSDNDDDDNEVVEMQQNPAHVSNSVTSKTTAINATCQCCLNHHDVEIRRMAARLDRVTSYVNMMMSRLANQDANESVNQDWNALSKIVDRLLFILSVITTVVVLIWFWLTVSAEYVPRYRQDELRNTTPLSSDTT